jgi:hypothetical protein
MSNIAALSEYRSFLSTKAWKTRMNALKAYQDRNGLTCWSFLESITGFLFARFFKRANFSYFVVLARKMRRAESLVQLPARDVSD